jgi:hypothetical protein
MMGTMKKKLASDRWQSTRVHVRVDPVVMAKLKEQAEARMIGFSEYVREVLYEACGWFPGENMRPMMWKRLNDCMSVGEEVHGKD